MLQHAHGHASDNPEGEEGFFSFSMTGVFLSPLSYTPVIKTSVLPILRYRDLYVAYTPVIETSVLPILRYRDLCVAYTPVTETSVLPILLL